MRVVALLLLAAATGAAGTAGAAPLAQIDATLDGKPAHVALDGGALTVDGAPVLALPGVTAAQLQARDVPRGPTIVATITTPHGQEAIGLEKRGAWHQVFRVPVGAADPDGDTGIAVALLPNGVHRYQTRPGLHRCDGQPALFFAEGWTGAKFQRLASQATLVPDNTPVINAGLPVPTVGVAADPGAARTPAPLLYHATIASREVGVGDVGGLTAPAEIDDGDPATAWRDPGKPAGQFITFEPRAGAKAAELRIVAAKTGALPSHIALVGAHAAYRVALPNTAPAPGAIFDIPLPAPIDGCVTAVIESAQPAAIAELDLYSAGELSGGGEAALAAIIASGADGAMAAEQALATRGPAAVTALEAALEHAKDVTASARLVHALIATKDPSAGPVLAKAATELRLREQDLAGLLAALGALGQTTVLAALAERHDLGVPSRIVAVQAIASAPGDPTAQLLPLAGRGPAPLRHAVIDALAGAPVAVLVPAATGAQLAQASGDLWRAVTRRGHAVPAERAYALSALLQALPAAGGYERQYRIFDGIAELGDAAALGKLADALRAASDGADRAALAQVIARAFARAPRPEALPLALALARDADPGARYAALTALGDPAWPAAADAAFEPILAGDHWPDVRRHAAEVFGGRCAVDPQLVAHAASLVTAVERDAEPDVREGALAALVQCKVPDGAALLAKVWDDHKQPLAVRRRAVDLATQVGDPSLGPVLLKKLAEWRGAALDSTDALALAQNAAYAIGRLAPPGAAAALLAALGDAAYPDILAAAAAGLGELGRACPPEAAGMLAQLAHSEDPQVAVAAGRAAAQCGK